MALMTATAWVPSGQVTPAIPDYQEDAGGGGGVGGGIDEGTVLFKLKTASDSNVKFKVNNGAASPGPVEVHLGDVVEVGVYYV